MKWIWMVLSLMLVISCQRDKVTTDDVIVENVDTMTVDSPLVELDTPEGSIVETPTTDTIPTVPPALRGSDEFPDGAVNATEMPGEYSDPFENVPGYDALDEHYGKAFEGHTDFLTDGFDFPVGKPNADGYYIAQKYLQNRHLGDDFNAVTGGNSDLGDPVYAIANGIVTFSYDLEGGWGNTIRIVHRHPIGDMVESLYSHMDEINVNVGDFVKRGDQIGTIGTAHGLYMAHLHLEIRTQVNMPLGRGYSDDPAPAGYTAPTPFIRRNRPSSW